MKELLAHTQYAKRPSQKIPMPIIFLSIYYHTPTLKLKGGLTSLTSPSLCHALPFCIYLF